MNFVTSTPQINRTGKIPFLPRVNEWVDLRDVMPGYGYHQALLLCELADDQWSAWVPNHGETVLRRDQFMVALEDQ
ncbi:hypothetical protein C7271_13665 [filamentous cyanobacterium CCP5]|nr:hypothetical protein C7271_13665 [filamentous cyanobacterium CCP5]